MRSETHSFLVPASVHPPRGVVAVEQWLGMALRVLRKGLVVGGIQLWRGLENHGRLRAQHQILVAARRYEHTDPERCALLRSVAANMGDTQTAAPAGATGPKPGLPTRPSSQSAPLPTAQTGEPA